MSTTVVHDAGLRALVDPAAAAEKIAGGCIFTEGPVWRHEENSLIFSDIPASRMYRLAKDGTIGVYRELIRMHREDELSFAGVVTFNLDEYHPMSKDSIHSYHRFMWENLFSPIDIRPENLGRRAPIATR